MNDPVINDQMRPIQLESWIRKKKENKKEFPMKMSPSKKNGVPLWMMGTLFPVKCCAFFLIMEIFLHSNRLSVKAAAHPSFDSSFVFFFFFGFRLVHVKVGREPLAKKN